MSSKYFICCYCKRLCLCNIRIKKGQRYCGNRTCQQARKNKWERDRLCRDEFYRLKRLSSKKDWYATHRGDRYQDSYRRSHPSYVEVNRLSQHVRNTLRLALNASVPEIVKTDALNPASLIASGLYVILPYREADVQKIVKTDALIVELRSCKGLQAFIQLNGP